MQHTMRSPLLRITLALEMGIPLVVLMTPVISLLTWKNSDTTGAFAIVYYLTVIPVNYIYNTIFNLVLLRCGKPLYERNIKLRMTHALLLEAILLPVQIPLAMHMLDLNFSKALPLSLTLSAIVAIYNFFLNKTFDEQK